MSSHAKIPNHRCFLDTNKWFLPKNSITKHNSSSRATISHPKSQYGSLSWFSSNNGIFYPLKLYWSEQYSLSHSYHSYHMLFGLLLCTHKEFLRSNSVGGKPLKIDTVCPCQTMLYFMRYVAIPLKLFKSPSFLYTQNHGKCQTHCKWLEYVKERY
jgi:hypothetical protein